MDSDASSLEDEVGLHQDVPRPSRNNMNDTSDVSDEDNISRAAQSIESPPESPQIGHIESPPPSPDAPASPDSIIKPRSPSPDDSGSESPGSYQSPRKSSHGQRNSSPPISSPQSPRSPSHPSESPNHSHSSIRSPITRHDSPIHSPNSSKSPCHRSEDMEHSTLTRSGWQRFDATIIYPTLIRSPSQTGKSSPHSPDSVRSPSQRSETSVRSSNSIKSLQNGSDSPQQSQTSPYRERESPNNRSSYFHRSSQGSHSPSHSVKHERERSIRSSKLVNENKSHPLRSYRSIRSPPSPSSPPAEDCGPQSPDGHDTNSDDGRSNISSASSFSSSNRRSPSSLSKPRSPPPMRVKTLAELKSHAEDLSDVSDLDSLGSVSDMEDGKDSAKKMENGETTTTKINVPEMKKDLRSSTTTGLEGEETEQLDFEAEEREEGECEGLKPTTGGGGCSEDEGELKGDELEEGELTDEGENRPEETEPRPICRFYNRGQCTWGSNCRFVHPGVTDKGNYTMFEMVRPLVPVNGPPQMYPPVDYRPVERPVMGPPPVVVARKEEVPVVESAWERGLRQAKEMLRKSTKRKETEVDFEEKKMNLTLGQDELDKENDYYTRTASPILNEETQRWSGKMEGEPKRYRTVSERFEDYGGGPENVYFTGRGGEWQPRSHHYEEVVRPSHRVMRTDSRSKYQSNPIHSYHSRVIPQQEYYERKRQKSYASREVIVQRTEKSWKDDSPPPSKTRHAEGRSGARGDEWADPWMRSKSPLSRKAAASRSRKQSYSSGSSYSSSSSRSRSSSSSGSSYSHDSRSRSHSSRSRSRSKKPVSPARRLLRGSSPVKGKAVSPALMEKKAATERALHMNPPPPSPVTLKTNPDRSRGGVPPRLLAHSKAAVAAAMRSTRSHSKSSRSSTGSDSSGSSSDSSESSFSSSSSSRAQSPPVRQKRIVIDEKLALAQAMKVKAMDALKLSGQKQQIKLTLKGSGGVGGSGISGIIPTGERMSTAIIAGKKRPAESPPDMSPPKVGGKTTPKKTAPSRREELLKQLKAVEDAIARKRSKIL